MLLRSLYTAEPEMHDVRKKWVVASEIAKTNDFSHLLSHDHHSSRWGVILPTALAIKLNGKNLISYLSLLLILYAVLFAVLLKFATQSIAPGLIGLFCVLLFYEPMFFRASTQLQPFLFGVVYIVMALWLISSYAAKPHIWLLISAALFAFLAYTTKESYLFFLPGLALLILIKAGIKPCCYFALLLILFLGVETWWFNSLSENLTYGRIEYLVSGKHLAKMAEDFNIIKSEQIYMQYYLSLPAPQQVFELVFRRWQLLPVANQMIAIFSFFYLTYLSVSRKFLTLDTFSTGVILITVSYIAFLTLIPSSLSPLLPLQPLLAKYLTPTMPFFIYIFALSLNEFICRLSSNTKRSVLAGTNIFASLFLVYALVFESPASYTFRADIYPNKSAMIWKYNHLNNAFYSGYGVCELKSRMIIRTRNFIRNYLNEEKILDHLTVSNFGNSRVMHHQKYNVEELTGFIPHRNLSITMTRDQCFNKEQVY